MGAVGPAEQTKPIYPEGLRRPSPRPPALTLPPVTGGHGAKQSQFCRRVERGNCLAGKELWCIGHACETKPISLGLYSRGGPIVRNKPNSRRRRVGRCHRGVGSGAIVQTRPIGGARRRAVGDRLRQTKPIGRRRIPPFHSCSAAGLIRSPSAAAF
jgi:hypothetical protein